MVEECLKSFDPSDKRPIKLFFQDEARFGRINKIASCWAPKDIRPVVTQHQIRQYVYVYSVVCPNDGKSFSFILPCVNAVTSDLFFEGVSREFADFRCIIFLDNAPWHTLSLFTKYDNVRFIALPPYSPELNAAEHLWDHIRENDFNNRGFNTLDDVEDALVVALERVRHDTKTMQSLTGFEWITSVNV